MNPNILYKKKKRVNARIIFFVIFCGVFFVGNIWPGMSIYNWTRKGENFFSKGSYSRALDSFQRAIQINQNYLPALMGLGQTYRKLAAFKNALKIFNHALKLQVKTEEVYSQIGYTYLEAGEISKAMAAFERARKVHFGYFGADLGVARLFRLKGQYSQAKLLVHRMERRFPLNFELYLEKFHLGLALEDINMAEEALKKASTQRPNSIKLQYYWALLSVEKYFMNRQSGAKAGKYLEEALDNLEQALNLNRKNQFIQNLKGDIHILRNEWDKAGEVFDRLSLWNKNYYLYNYKAGFVAEKKGNSDKAIKFFQKALLKNDENSAMRNHVENFLINGNFSPNHFLRKKLSTARYLNAEAFYDKNLWERAFYELARSLVLDPSRIKAHERLLYYYKYKKLYVKYLDRIKKIIKVIHPENTRILSRYQYKLQRAIKKRRNHLYHQHSFNFPFARKPVFIQLNPVRGSQSQIIHPGVKKDLFMALSYSLNIHDRFKTISPIQKEQESDFILETNLLEGFNHLKANFVFRHRQTGIIKGRFQIEESGRGAMDRIALQVSKLLGSIVPMSGKIIKSRPDFLIVNMGVPENLLKKKIIEFYRIRRPTYFFETNISKKNLIARGKVVEVDGYISKVILDNPENISRLRMDDLAIIGKETKKNVTKITP